MSEQEIKACPNCDGTCEEGETFVVEGGLEFTEVKCMNCPYAGPDIAAHNDLCDLVEKGRKYEEVYNALVEAEAAISKQSNELTQLTAERKDHERRVTALEQRLPASKDKADEAVRLLRKSEKFTYIKDNGSIVLSPTNDEGRKEWIENRDTFLANIDKKVSGK